MVISAWTFTSVVPIEKMQTLLAEQLAAFSWAIHESEFEGRYLLGKLSTEEKIKIVFYEDGTAELELWGEKIQGLAEQCLDIIDAEEIAQSA